MISLSLKKHPTILLNTVALISHKRILSLRLLAYACATSLLWLANFLPHADAAGLKWVRPTQSQPQATSTQLQFRKARTRQTISTQAPRDTNIATVAWEQEKSEITLLAGEGPTLGPASSREPLHLAQQTELDPNDDPFALDVEEEPAPEPEEEPAEEEDIFAVPSDESESEPESEPEFTIESEPEAQLIPEPKAEPTIDELLDALPEPTDPIEEPASEDSFEAEMTDEQFQNDLFGTDESEEPAEEPQPEVKETTEPETTESEVTEPEETTEPVDKAETPKSVQQPELDPFDEPSLDDLSTEDLEEAIEDSLDIEIERRMNALDNESTEEPAVPAPTDTLNSTDIFDEPLEDETSSDSDPSKLFDDAENLDIEIGDPAGNDLTEAERNQQLQQLAKERQEGQKNCDNEFAKMKSDLINDIDLSLRLEGNPGEDFPYECAIGHSKLQPRQWAQVTYNWKASGLCHKPLYFEQVQLERYGHSWGPYVQPIMSGVHFFGTLPILPYKMGIRTPNECVYTLGYYRPGNCAPYLVGGVPFTWRAALYQGTFATGLPFAIP